jgi:iron-sulfur cluster repair protein YtfE (RIC family)
MRNGSYEQTTPATVAQKLPEASALMRAARIDTSARLRLTDAALATSTNIDELLANCEDRARRAARRAHQTQPAPAVLREAEVGEFMLV